MPCCRVKIHARAVLFGCLAAFAILPASAMPPSPTAAAKLRRLLPFPEATLDPKMEITFGLGYSLGEGFHFFRQSSDYAGRIVAVRRQMTGGPADAARYRRLGGLYRQAGRPPKSKAAFQQSEALYAAMLKRRPGDGAALAGYGRTLDASGQTASAEAYLRRATQTVPNSAEVWLALGLVLENEASPQTEEKKHWGQAILLAYDKAASLAPQNPAVWATRGQLRCWGLPQLHGKVPSQYGLSDYVRAAALLPQDPDAQALVVSTDCFTFEIAHHVFTSLKAAKMEPAASDHRAEKYLRRITAIAQSAHGAQAAEAYTARAWVQFEFFYDPKGAQKSLRLALQQNPSQQDAVDYQMHIASDDLLMAAACRRELRRRPQVCLRVLLADADFNIARQKPRFLQEARAQMELAHAAAPHDDALRLGFAALLLKSGDAADLTRASALLREIAPSAPGRAKVQQAEYGLTCGVSAALTGSNDNARRFLTLAGQEDPHNQAAKKALAVLP